MNSNTDNIPFSVLMSVYINDDDTFFDVALTSVLKDQTRTPTQVVLVVDGPIGPEKTMIIERHEEAFPTTLEVLRLPRNIGQGPALNQGLKRCKYEYVARMDADDISLPDRFEKQIHFVSNNPEVDLSSGFVEELNSDNLVNIRKVPLTSPELVRYSKTRSPINHGACIYRRSLVEACGGYNQFHQVQDYALFVNMMRMGAKLMNQPDILVQVRLYDNYARKSGKKYFIEEFQLAWYFYQIGHIGAGGFIRNLAVRAFPRLLGSRAMGYLYRRFLR